MIKFFCLLIFSFLLVTFSSTNSDDHVLHKEEIGYGVVLKILNKVSTKRFEVVSPIGQSLELEMHKFVIFKCVVIDKNKIDEHLALLKFESIEKNPNVPDFLGWLIKSSPSLNNIEHPILDIKLESCLKNDPLFPNIKLLN